MGITLSTTGNGRLVAGDQSNVIIDYQVTEGITPTSLSSEIGEIPSLSIQSIGNSVNTDGMTHPTSKLLIGNMVEFADSERGSFSGRVTSVSITKDSLSFSALSIFDKLNVTKYAASQSGTIDSVFAAYFEMVGLTASDYDIDFSTDLIVTPPWNMNVWKAMKMLSATVGAEMYFTAGKVYVRPIAAKLINVENSSMDGFSVETPGTTEKSTYGAGVTTSVVDAIAYSLGQGDSIIAVDFKEVSEQVVKTTMAVQSVNQPEYITQVPSKDFFPEYVDYIQPESIGTEPSVYTDGFYAFYDVNNKIVPLDMLSGAGVKVELTDSPYEIKLTITGPDTSATTPWRLAFSSVDPALAITATGVSVEQHYSTSPVGMAADGNGTAQDVDYSNNPFSVSKEYMYNTMYKTNQKLAGPNVSISLSTDIIEEAASQEFGFLPGAIFEWDGSKYRVITSEYSYGEINFTAEQYVTFADFNSLWSGKTFNDFTDTMFTPATAPDDYMTHSDFAIIPMMEPV